MSEKELRNYLIDIPYIENIRINESVQYKDKVYNFVIKCLIVIGESRCPLALCIPYNWKIDLFDAYWDGSNQPFIPHIDNRGKICVYDVEGTFIDYNLEGLLKQFISQTKKNLEDGITGKNKEDFLKEFNSYICCLPECIVTKLVIAEVKKSQKLYYSGAKKKLTKGVKKKESVQSQCVFASCNNDDFKFWSDNMPRRRGIYIYIEPDNAIYPPPFNKKISIEYINSILENISGVKAIRHEFMEFHNRFVIVFEIKQNSDITNVFGVLLKNVEFETDGSIRIKRASETIPICIERVDKKFLLNRTSVENNVLENKKYLLIGCGSIGSYIFYDLIKSGAAELTLVDSEVLKPENIYRHLLGREFLNCHKAKALSDYAEISLPNTNIKTCICNIEEAIEEYGINFKEYDYIINATGSTILNRWLNRYIWDNKIDTPVFYVWNEPLDIGSHVAYIKYGNTGCYDCFFYRNEDTGILYDSTSYCNQNQAFTQNMYGCSGSYIPYGSMVSLQSSLLFMDILKKVATGRIVENVIASEKGDDYYLKNAGYRVSEKYLSQEEHIELISGSVFKNCNCEVCKYDCIGPEDKNQN